MGKKRKQEECLDQPSNADQTVVQTESKRSDKELILEKFREISHFRVDIIHLWDIFYRVNFWSKTRITNSFFVKVSEDSVTDLTKGQIA